MTEETRSRFEAAAKRMRLISTDFDGTLYAEYDPVPIARDAEALLIDFQQAGAVWAINTGRDLSSLIESMGRSGLKPRPDYLVVVEREIYKHDGAQYVPWENWNRECTRAHRELFARVRPGIPRLVTWMEQHFDVTLYEDPYSPLCVIASGLSQTDEIQEELERFAREIEGLAIVRNDVYIRFSHSDYNKGAALAAIAAHHGLGPDSIVAAGDHLNDIPMLQKNRAEMLIAPGNAVEEVKELVRSQGGYVSSQLCGQGLARGLEAWMEKVLAA